MLLGIISDTHDHIEKVKKAIEIFNQYDLICVIHCGDFVAPFTLKEFTNLKTKFYGVFGNCDGEKEGLLKVAKENNFLLSEAPLKLSLGNKKFLIFHKLKKEEIKDVDYVIHGHTHLCEIKKENNIFFINPGEACGLLTEKATIAFLNIKENKVNILEI
ncbi:MAG: metallophosphoesterase [candidate division WOR-3 bacterium]|nr:metallophosphoesterase [candidate division WOR-3 bacterium]MCX7837500.1 metallophosphoesterase [candidate division WOR-3 bacterium]MDW8113393.1 metallophosphoesterase [candidate division WOR-3 bacterium]